MIIVLICKKRAKHMPCPGPKKAPAVVHGPAPVMRGGAGGLLQGFERRACAVLM
ncbi:hypothetical protein SALB1_1876 [Salinisphaera sp. LB1]|nr:hypothetical protein SALB1_1876 [Salinisphaera sp. LB1]